MLAQDAAQLIARQLRSLCRPDEITAAIEKYYEPDWPTEYVNTETGRVYKPHHEAEAQVVFSDSPVNVLLKGGEAGGKALALNTPLPTPTGWTTMSEVGVGDRLFDERGTPCRVTAISLVMYGHCCYEITFDDGLRITADAEHLWLTTNSLARKSLARRGEKYTTGSHAHLPHCQPKYDPEIHTTEEILGTLKDVRGFTNHSIPLAKPLVLPAADLPIDPYTLGAWLGDGTSRAAEITIGAQDKDEMIALLEAAGHRIIARARNPISFGIDTDRSMVIDQVTKQFRRNPDAFYARLCALNLIQNKHIPLLYLRGDYEQRLALLQGLMDTDGYISARGKCEYCTASRRLADDFEELSLSLGIKVTCREGRVKCNDKWFTRYRFSFTPYVPIFRLSRKARYVKSAGRQSVRRYRRYIVSIQECASVPVRCVVVDSPSHLFLAGRGMIPTHNSVAGIVKTLERLRRSMHGLMICVSADTLVDGIPIAERALPAPVNTLFGPALASPSFHEGRADLFRVVTESGDQVVVTANHRFLTPTGWRPLHDLRAGSLIAVDDSDHGRAWREISPGSLVDCWLGSRPCGEPANPGERCTQGKQLLPGGGKASMPSPARGRQVHVCIDHFSCPSISVAGAEGCQIPFGVGRSALGKCCALRGSPLCASRTDNPPKYRRDPTPHSPGSGARRQNGHAGELLCSPGPRSTPLDEQCPVSLVPGRTRLQSHRGCTCIDFPYPYYNIKWGRLSSITFQQHGDFYGLTVPSVGHYSAQGIFHHNSPDLPHFKRSLWPEFSRWCPWEQVVPEQRYRSKFSWEPRAPFSLAFRNGATLMCGGIDDPGAWEGPNVSFAYFDEARRKKSPAALKTLTGRVRIPGPKGEPPQLFITTTPRKHWLYEYYGPLKCRCESCGKRFEHYANTQAGQNYLNLCPSVLPICPHCGSQNYHTDDEHAEFKLKALVVTLLTLENEGNLQEGFTNDRALSLTSAEARVLLEAEWEDIEAGERFLPNMLLWDACREDLPPLGPREPLVVALDAATGRKDSASDCFGIVGVTRHPDPARRKDSVAVRYVQKWQARPGKSIDFQGTESNPGPERVLRTLAKQHNVIMAPYDPDQLHDMATRLLRERIVWMFPFPQQSLRIKADTDLLYLITHSKIAHDGNKDLRDHIDNADRKLDSMGKKLRIVKREESLKVDLAVCLSMASLQVLRLNLG